MTRAGRRCKPGLFTLLLLAAYTAPASAHYLDIAQFSLYPDQDPLQFQLQATLPLTLDPLLPVELPPGCTLLGREQNLFSESWRVDMRVSCATDQPGSIQTRWGRDGFMVRQYALDGSSASGMFSGKQPGASLPVPDWDAAGPAGQTLVQTAQRYLNLGAVHVLVGWDHLAFVFCLTLLASGWPLIGLITAFTVGHSVSLALAHFGLVRLPIVPVEAIIALSIVFIAREAWLRHFAYQAASQSSYGSRVVLTVLFGLVHGLGFASVLEGLGVSAADTVIALAFFNIGVEVGQIAFVIAVLVTLHLLERLDVRRLLVPAMTGAVGGMGLFWTVERVMFAV